MRTHVQRDIGKRRAGFLENRTQRFGFGNPIPWIETLVEIRTLCTYSIPKDCVHGFKEARAPSGDGEAATRSDVMPKLPYSLPHIGHKEDAEDTNNGVELGRRQLQVEHVAGTKFDVLKAPVLGLGTCKRKEVCSKVDAENVSIGSHSLRCWNGGCPTAAAYIEDSCAGTDAQARNGAAAISLPERIDWMIVEIRGGVISGSRSLFGVLWGAHPHLPMRVRLALVKQVTIPQAIVRKSF